MSLEPRLRDTLVKRIYEKITDTIVEEKGSYHIIFSRFLPQLLSEVDALRVIFPEAGEVLKTTFERLWESRFPDIPAPELKPEVTGRDIQEKTYQTLMENRDKIINQNQIYTTKMIEQEIQKETVLFMDRVLRTFFKFYNLIE